MRTFNNDTSKPQTIYDTVLTSQWISLRYCVLSVQLTLVCRVIIAFLLSRSVTGVGWGLPTRISRAAPWEYLMIVSTASSVDVCMSFPFSAIKKSPALTPAWSADEPWATSQTITGALPWNLSPYVPVLATGRFRELCGVWGGWRGDTRSAPNKLYLNTAGSIKKLTGRWNPVGTSLSYLDRDKIWQQKQTNKN